MRISFNDRIIEVAKKHSNLKERIEIYWKAMIYYIEWEVIDERMEEYLSKWKRISEKMKGNKNRCATTEKTDVAELKNRCGRTEKNRCATTEKPRAKPSKDTTTDEALAIYISNNKLLYGIVYSYIHNNIDVSCIKYLINKHWESKYIYTQMLEAEKIIKKIWFDEFKDILNYIPTDDFRCKQILSVAKLNRKNKEWVPYYIVIQDKMKPIKKKQQDREREIELHRRKIAEQIQSFKSEINANETTWNQEGGYNWRENISFS